MTRSTMMAAFAVGAAALAGVAHAAPVQPFSDAAFHAAQAQGRSILVDVHADWCPTCRAQDPTIQRLAASPAFAKLVILKLDYDSQVKEERALGVNHQSTLIAFRGGSETGRSVGVTDPGGITSLAQTTLR